MPQIFDNIQCKLLDSLAEAVQSSNRTDFCAGYFNLRGWGTLAPLVDNLPNGCRLLIGMPVNEDALIRKHYYRHKEEPLDNAARNLMQKQLAASFVRQLETGLPCETDRQALRQLSRQLKDGKVKVRLHLRYPLHAKLYIAYPNNTLLLPRIGYLGSSNLTFAGLVQQGELNIDVKDDDATQKLADWFEERWNDSKNVDITKDLTEIIDNSWARETPVPPHWIYIKLAYHLSHDARMGIADFKIPPIFKNVLLNFQEKAVSIAAKRLNEQNGVVIGDVVGLGKTMIGTALAKMFEDDFSHNTLIICPANLQSMWNDYAERFQLHAKIISHSIVHTFLPEAKRYRTVLIDESHNLRNGGGTRYHAIKDYIDRNASKVILLTATPYNKTYGDLVHQLRLFLPDEPDERKGGDLGMSPEKYIKQLGGIVEFQMRHPDVHPRSIKAFALSDYADDWQELMRLFLVRRTRNFIRKYYTKEDENGKRHLAFSDGRKSYFPDRVPKKAEYPFDPSDPSDQYAALYSENIVDTITALDLPRYGLQIYRNDKAETEPDKDESDLLKRLNKAGKRLMGFCRTMLFKRLESSGASFLLSLARHLLRNCVFLYALENNKRLPIGKNITHNLDMFLEDDDVDEDNGHSLNISADIKTYLAKAEDIYTMFESMPDKFDWLRSEFFTKELKECLQNDNKKILTILQKAKTWNPDKDRKLNALHELMTKQHGGDKILVFTQFADTAKYLTEQLKRRGVSQIESVTGSDENPSWKAKRFSPKSSGYQTDDESRVLISTDVLSEGQNLQDAHIIINFDLPWAIIRLIQRAGRVDRIGQTAPQILCYSFLPEDGIEKIINLRSRLAVRIKQNADVIGSDETFFDGDPVNLADLYNEKSGAFDESSGDDDSDIGSKALEIWEDAVAAQPELKKIIPELPNVLAATKQDAQLADGVIVYTKTANDDDILSYLDSSGNTVTQSQTEILRAAKCFPNTPAVEQQENHDALIAEALDKIKQDDQNRGTALGKRSGVKYRVYTRLDRYCTEHKDQPLLITENLKRAMNEILLYPMRESAKESFVRQMKLSASDAQLAEMAELMLEKNSLVYKIELDPQNAEPQIICSMGINNGN